MTDIAIALVTCPNEEVGSALAKKLVEGKFCACVNISAIRSIYSWKGNIEDEKEALLIIKTTKERLKDLEKFVLKNHPYDTPEFVIIDPLMVNEKYRDWVINGCKSESGI